MTAICYRNGVLAGDTHITIGDMRVGLIQKIWKCADGSIAGFAGDVEGVAAFRAYTEKECLNGFKRKFKRHDIDGEGLVIKADGTITILASEAVRLVTIQAAYYALGSGRDFIMGAMAFGATADQAVSAATQAITTAGGQVCVVKLDSVLAKEAETAAAQAQAEAEAAALAAAQSAPATPSNGQDGPHVVASADVQPPRRLEPLRRRHLQPLPVGPVEEADTMDDPFEAE